MEIGAFEAKNRLGMLLDLVAEGEEIVITRHGKPAARLVPYEVEIDEPQVRAALERIRARAGNFREPFDWAAIKADRDAGRR